MAVAAMTAWYLKELVLAEYWSVAAIEQAHLHALCQRYVVIRVRVRVIIHHQLALPIELGP